MRTSRIVLTVVGALLALFGLAVTLAGTGILLASAQRDADGYLSSPTFDLRSDGHAVSTDEAVLLVADPGIDRIPGIGDLEVRVEIIDATGDVFVGIAPDAEVTRYLDGVSHDAVRRLEPGFGSDLRTVGGDAPAAAPASLDIWAASASGPAPLTLTWEPEAGSWSAVVMNADASEVVDVSLRAGVRTDAMVPIGLGTLLVGLLALLGGVAIVVLAVSDDRRRAGRRDDAGGTGGPGGTGGTGGPGGSSPTYPTPAAVPPSQAGAATPYPLILSARLDPDLSRWRWLVKWFLAIPHLLLLAVLGLVFLVLTVVAGVAILITGRYPRGIFDVNVGILRWVWRVSVYAFGVLGTDRYPPFTLDDDPTYPAHLDVAYPDRLSRGLVLVKWWLLAIPHLLIVGLLTGGAYTWTVNAGTSEAWQLSLGGGLVGLLVLIAAIALLITGRYPPRLFDLVVGLQRWVYRVTAYVALMTDDYPPFRLDQGGSEPPVLADTPPRPPAPTGAVTPGPTPPAAPPAGPDTPRTPAVH